MFTLQIHERVTCRGRTPAGHAALPRGVLQCRRVHAPGSWAVEVAGEIIWIFKPWQTGWWFGTMDFFDFPYIQWPFQVPKLEVPTIYKAYVREYPHKIWPYMVRYLHSRILEFRLIYWKFHHPN